MEPIKRERFYFSPISYSNIGYCVYLRNVILKNKFFMHKVKHVCIESQQFLLPNRLQTMLYYLVELMHTHTHTHQKRL